MRLGRYCGGDTITSGVDGGRVRTDGLRMDVSRPMKVRKLRFSIAVDVGFIVIGVLVTDSDFVGDATVIE